MTSVTVENDLVLAADGGTELALDLYRSAQSIGDRRDGIILCQTTKLDGERVRAADHPP
jgi:hypothetical protein